MSMKNKYRIVTDNYAGYEVQIKYWWWPFNYWRFGINTFVSVDQAKAFIRLIKSKRDRKRKVVWDESPINEAKRILK